MKLVSPRGFASAGGCWASASDEHAARTAIATLVLWAIRLPPGSWRGQVRTAGPAVNLAGAPSEPEEVGDGLGRAADTVGHGAGRALDPLAGRLDAAGDL